MRTTRTEASARPSAFILHMQPTPRQVCLADGSDILGRSDGVMKILEIPRDYCAPGAVGAIRRQVIRYMRFRRTDQSIKEYIAEYDLLLRKAESEMEMEAGFQEQFAPILRTDNAALSRYEKSLVMAGCRRSLRLEDASANMRRLSGSRGSGRRRDALLAEKAVEPNESDAELDISAENRKAKKTRGGEEEGGPSKKGRGRGHRGRTNTEWI